MSSGISPAGEGFCGDAALLDCEGAFGEALWCSEALDGIVDWYDQFWNEVACRRKAVKGHSGPLQYNGTALSQDFV